jgi:hypothetical protein
MFLPGDINWAVFCVDHDVQPCPQRLSAGSSTEVTNQVS